MRTRSLRASSPIWASETSLARTRNRRACLPARERASERRSREGPRLLSRASCASTFLDFPQMESLLAGYWLKEGLTVRNTGKANVPSPLSNKFTFPASLRVKQSFSTNLSTFLLSTAYSTQLLSAVIAVSASFKSSICTMSSFHYSTRI